MLNYWNSLFNLIFHFVYNLKIVDWYLTTLAIINDRRIQQFKKDIKEKNLSVATKDKLYVNWNADDW